MSQTLRWDLTQRLSQHPVDSLGGELLWATGLSVVSDIPTKGHWPLKLHTFVNAGRLGRLDTGMLPTVVASSNPPSLNLLS